MRLRVGAWYYCAPCIGVSETVFRVARFTFHAQRFFPQVYSAVAA